MSDMTQISRTLGNIEAKVDGINVRLDKLNSKTARNAQKIAEMQLTVASIRRSAANKEKLGLQMRERIIWAISILVVVLLLSQRLNIELPKATTDLVEDEIVELDN